MQLALPALAPFVPSLLVQVSMAHRSEMARAIWQCCSMWGSSAKLTGQGRARSLDVQLALTELPPFVPSMLAQI